MSTSSLVRYTHLVFKDRRGATAGSGRTLSDYSTYGLLLRPYWYVISNNTDKTMYSQINVMANVLIGKYIMHNIIGAVGDMFQMLFECHLLEMPSPPVSY